MSSNTNEWTLLDYFFDNVAKHGSLTFMTQPMGKGEIRKFTYSETLEEAKKMSAYLSTLDLPPNSQIAICSKNCAWWIMADLAIQMAGHVTVPIFPTLTEKITEYTLKHSESRLLFIGKMDIEPYEEMKDGFIAGIPTISFPLCPEEGCAEKQWEEITGDSETLILADAFQSVVRKPEEMATIIYTSGSTGTPKGVMTSFKAMLSASKGFQKENHVTQKDRYLSYLPMAHGMERWLGECMPMYTGLQVFFAESLSTFVDDLNRCKPTCFLSVPRLWKKFQTGVFVKMPEKKLNKLLKFPIVNILVKRKVLKNLGLDQCRLAGSGSAPLSQELLLWYRNLGLELCEGYGMTENFNYSHFSRPGKGKYGYVGETYDDIQHRINPTDGEIQVLTPGMMMGYYKNEEATRDTITEDGWVRTGDKGAIDKDEFLRITGRTKEIFKTSKGKYVAPAPIESLLTNNHLLELAVVTGRSYAQPFAILQLADAPKLKAFQKDAAASRDQYAVELENHFMKKVNPSLEAHERISFVVLVSDNWSPENGFLTPTQKIKRSVIEDKYESLFDSWNEKKEKVLWHGVGSDVVPVRRLEQPIDNQVTEALKTTKLGENNDSDEESVEA